jgi:hypothetical protein
VKKKSKNEYEELILRKNFNNKKSNREQSNALRSQFETFKLNQKLNNREINQVFAFN